MKKLLAVLGVSCALLAGLVGYAAYINIADQTVEPSSLVEVEITPAVTPAKIKPVATPANESPTVEENIVESEDLEWTEETEELVESTEVRMDLNTHDGNSYAYHQLDDDGRDLYDVIYSSIVNYDEGAVVPTLDTDEIDVAFNCVMIDHPEIFYVNGYRYTRYTKGDELKKITFTASYCYSESEKDNLWPKIDAAAKAIESNVIPTATDYDKVKYVYETIINGTDYDLNSPDNQNVISVLLNHRSVCQGYAKTMQLLLNRMDVPCTLVTGVVTNGERHAWNAVKADGDWYYVDATWGDASYNTSDQTPADFAPPITYDYLLITSAMIDPTHKSDSVVSMPYAQAMTDNYYVREGLYVAGYNADQMKAIFDYSRALGKTTAVFKCADTLAFDQIHKEMIDNQHVFDYVKSGQIRYYEDPELLKFTFALQ